MSKPLREICSQTRDIYCRFFKDKVVYEIPCLSGFENPFGRALHVEVSLVPRSGKFDPVLFKEPITLQAKSLVKENYKTTVVLEELK